MTAPITAEVYIARGVDAATAVEYAKQHNALAGFRTAEPAAAPTAFGVRPAAAPPAPTIPPAEMAPSAEAIAKRMKRYTESGIDRSPEQIAKDLQMEHHLDALKTHGIRNLQAAWNQSATDEATAQEPAFQKLVEQDMKPAEREGDFEWPRDPKATAETLAHEHALRGALVKLGMPKAIGDLAAQTLERSVNGEASRLTPEELQKRIESTQDRLRDSWGADYMGRWDRLQAFMRQAAANPAIAALLRTRGQYLDADALFLHKLSTWVEYQHHRRST